MRKQIFVISLLLSMAQPALACLNDREVVTSETEFRSTYLHNDADSVAARFPYGLIEAGCGIALVAGAAYLLISSSRKADASAGQTPANP